MTIGRPQGSTWIGKPVDLLIPLSLDEGEAGDSLCLEAEVVQGDTRIDDRRVTVSLESGPSAATPRMHVRSTMAVDEPVVTVMVSAGCITKSTRRFTLLADVPADIAIPGVTTSGPRPLPETLSFSAGATTQGVSGNGLRSFDGSGDASSPRSTRRSSSNNGNARASERSADDASAAPAPRPRPVARAPAAPRRAVVAQANPAPAATTPRAVKPAPAPADATAKSAAPAGPRLQLDALEPAPVRDAGLQTSPSLAMPAADDPAKRAEAAALWRAVGTPAEDAQRDAQRMQSLEATLAALRDQTAQNQRTLLEMRSELADARQSRYRNPLVYTLIAMLLLALIGMLLLWRLAKRASAPAWWGEQPGPQANFHGPDGDPHGPSQGKGAQRALAPSGSWQSPAVFSTSQFDDLEAATDSTIARTPDGAPVRPVNTEELFDVQQQSDFFLSLGQHDQAIAVLSEHIADNPGTSALAYLDLLRIFHALGRRDEYAGLRQDFERAFNADVPEFDKFTEVGRGLEHYRSTLARIESQWPEPGTLALIEELVFRKPGAHEDEVFDLAAYQELLLLYSVAKEVIDPDSAPPAPVTPLSFVDTFGHGQEPTVPSPIEPQVPAHALDTAPMLPPSLYGAIDEGMQHDTVLGSSQAFANGPALAAVRPGVVPPQARMDLDLAEFDKTAFETMPAEIDAIAPDAPAKDTNLIDFDLFDDETEAEIAPKRPPIKR
ncbi:hypothetical protein [Variovorax sp. PAMC 28711]|uniref:hypothetical protein n=1 Tax=Variovorax sp. PAMC 28711 TaxID=1795631 RepID=UPI0012E914F6|nr:hypothetical protein [Variovorax sp. PAMC 28711]